MSLKLFLVFLLILPLIYQTRCTPPQNISSRTTPTHSSSSSLHDLNPFVITLIYYLLIGSIALLTITCCVCCLCCCTRPGSPQFAVNRPALSAAPNGEHFQSLAAMYTIQTSCRTVHSVGGGEAGCSGGVVKDDPEDLPPSYEELFKGAKEGDSMERR